MLMMLKYVLIVVLLATISGSFHLYNTKVSDGRYYKDCLYSFKLNIELKEWQLVPYCIRHNVASDDDAGDQCYGDANYTFEQLKSKNVSSHQLHRWNAPVDTTNNYQKYLSGDALSLASHRYCNCSASWFGTWCQYSFFQLNKTATFDEIIMSQSRKKQQLHYHYELISNPSMLTCYEGLRCHSMICLDWRQICDGSFNCENAEDEPEECLLLETNECESNEHRCRSGMCIPKTFLIDFGVDCMDLSDETEMYGGWMEDSSCYRVPRLMCDFRLCDVGYFSCGDGQCVRLFAPEWETSTCFNGRDLFLRRVLLLSSTTNGGNMSQNISFECWHLMLCNSASRMIELFGYRDETCECTWESQYHKRCLEYFQKHCPVSFVFQSEKSSLYPFVRFLYHNTPIYSSEWWFPTHLCYNQSHCPTFPFIGLSLIEGLLCVESKQIQDLYRLELLFSSCRITHSSMLADVRRLFYCARSMKFVSKYRVRDGFNDCFHSEDENVNATTMHTLNLTYHFKCNATDRWLPRPVIGKGRCLDYSDTFYIGSCQTASDIGCQFLRGLYSPPIYYLFQENCNGILRLKNLSVANETDETNCDEWPWPSYRRCDGYWDTKNGEDELNCPNTISSYITHTIVKCRINEHYCAHRNGTMGCIAQELAGDENVDCLGATDERAMSCAILHPLHPFQCSNGDCIALSSLCDRERNCPDGDDELSCPRMDFTQCTFSYFPCNDDCIPRWMQCDDVIDCLPYGEDEWFCDLGYKRITQFSLEKIDEYPSVIDSTYLMAATVSHPPALLPISVLLKSERNNPLDDWICNQGIIVTKRSSIIECFCPPSFYGSRCQYQAERLLITIQIDIPASLSRYQNQHIAIRLIAYLMLDDVIVHHEQIVHVPLMKQMFYLNYPLPPPKQRGNWTVRFDAFSVTTSSADFKASWLFDVPFSFLPVSRLVLHLTLKDQETCNTRACVHGNCRTYLNSPHREYCQCEQNWSGRHCNLTNICSCAGGGKCVDRLPTPICVCPLGRMGSECRVLFDPCSNINCQHGGKCLPVDERQYTNFICSCHSGYYGSRCELASAQVDIRFSDSLFLQSRPLSAAIFVHFLELQNNSPGILFIQNRLLHKQLQLNKPLRVFNNDRNYLSTFILVQIFFEPDNFGYYIGAIVKRQTTNITTTIYESTRCPHVNELLLNETIRGFSSMKKVKYYSRVCEAGNSTSWFHDEAYLCFCYKDRRPDCLFIQQESTQCATDYCKNNGRCVQNNFNGVWDFGCVCSGCTYGSLCQLTTSQYALSLDAMLGQDILENMPLTDQPILIKIVLAVLVLMLSLAFVSNVLSFITFKQPKVQEFGCGMYLFCLPLVGQLGLSILVGRFFYLLGTQVYNVNNWPAVHWSCIALEYFISVCPVLFDWLTVCVALERSVNIIKGVSFNKADSVWWAKRVIFLLTVVVLASSWHEPFIRQLIDDPRATTRHTWCVIAFPWSWLEYYRLTVNIINLIVPCSINLMATIFLLHKSTRMKQLFANKKSEKSYFASFKKQIPLYGSPLVLIALSLMRLTFLFTLVCITEQWQKYIYLTAYIISFAPLMGTFPIFVLPAEIYKTEFKKFVQRMRRKMRIIRL